MKEKLWSPKKPKPAWVIWYEDLTGEGDKHTFIVKLEAEQRILELIEGLVKDELEWRGPRDPEEEEAEGEDTGGSARDRLAELERLVKAEKAWAALEEWEAFAQDFTPEATLHVEETSVYGA